MPRNGPVVVLFLGTGKGGAGVSTVTANVAVLLMRRANQPIGVIDAGIGSNATLSKLLGAGYTNPSQCASGGLYEYLLGLTGLPQPMNITNNLKLVPPGCLNPYAVHWHLSVLSAKYAGDPAKGPDAFADYLLGKLGKLYAGLGSRVVIIDVPSNIHRPLSWAFIASADVINIVALDGSTHVGEAQETIDVVSQVLNEPRGNRHARVNLIVNRALDIRGGGLLAHLPTAGLHNVYRLPDSREVRVWTDECRRPAVLFSRYARGEDYRQWLQELERLVRGVWDEVSEAFRG
jgi:cellulose biosynthesis protein BcsQ